MILIQKKCSEIFYPQLYFYFLKFLDTYDTYIKGELISNFKQGLEQQMKKEHIETAKDPKNLKNIWENSQKSVPMGPQ